MAGGRTRRPGGSQLGAHQAAGLRARAARTAAASRTKHASAVCPTTLLSQVGHLPTARAHPVRGSPHVLGSPGCFQTE
eukprot:3558773-Prymnesium_polylepis.1